MTHEQINPQTMADCEYFDKGYCEKHGCRANALLINMIDEGHGPETMQRAQNLIDEANQFGCIEELTYPPTPQKI